MGMVGLVQVAVRHLGSYAELMTQAADEYRAELRRRIIVAAGALAMAVGTLLAGWATGLALLWDTEWRLTYCIGSVVFCLVVTAILVSMAVKPGVPGPNRRLLKAEARQDLALLQEWRESQ